MNRVQDILSAAAAAGHPQLSEYDSKQVLSAYGIPVTREKRVATREEAQAAAADIGYPVVLKACAAEIAHKTETGLVALDLRDPADLAKAYDRMRQKIHTRPADFLVQEMIRGERELVAGMTRDPQFGPCVMFGLGGIFTEALADVCFRAAPLSRTDAMEMIGEIRGRKLLAPFRGMPGVDHDLLARCLVAVGKIALDHDIVKAVDINPLIVCGNRPVAVDALIVLAD